MEYHEYDTRLAAYVVVVNEQDEILLGLANVGPSPEWTLIGGGVEFGETVEQAAVREAREESGYDIELGRVLGVNTYETPASERWAPHSRPLRSVRVVFHGRVRGGALAREVGGTTDEARWIPLAVVPSLTRAALVDAAIEMWRA